ncbi:hypothetical protein JCM8097_005604 [Rhodosporidiobolus ruineniae]
MPLNVVEGTHSDPATYNTLLDQTLASEDYSRWILGPSVIGWVGQIALWGMAAGWAGDYMRSDLFRRDTPRRRALLVYVLLICTAQAAFNFYLTFHWTTTQHRDAEIMLAPSRINSLQPLTVGFVGVPVQAFLASRSINLLQARWAKRLAKAFFSLVIFLEAASIIFNFVLNTLFHDDKLHGSLLIWLWLAAITDVSITILLIVVLRKRIAGFNASTDQKLRALSWLAVQSASYTAFFALTAAILAYATPPDDLRYTSLPFAAWYNLTSSYVLSLLTALCSRLILGGGTSRGAPTLTLAGAGPLNPLFHSDGDQLRGRSPSPAGFFNNNNGRGASPLPSPALVGGGGMGEKSPFVGRGNGVHIDEHVSIFVESADPDDELVPTRMPRAVRKDELVKPSLPRLFKKATRETDEIELEESRSDGSGRRKASFGSSAAAD